MGRIPKIYQANLVYEVTTRTIQGRFLLRPSPATNELIAGIVGRAQTLFPSIKVYGLSVLSNHMTWLVSSSIPKDIPRFMGYVNGRISRDIGRLVDWPGKLFERPAMAIPIVDDEALLNRFRYLLSQGVKENLVGKAEDWPGVSCVLSLLGKSKLQGTWFYRDKMRRLFLRKRSPEKSVYTEKYTVHFSKIPSHDDLSDKDYGVLVQDLLTSIESEAKEQRRSNKSKCMGSAKIESMEPHHRPQRIAKSPAPRCHASNKSIRICFIMAWKELVQWFKESAESLRKCDFGVIFPEGSFPSPFPGGEPKVVGEIAMAIEDEKSRASDKIDAVLIL